MKRGKERTLHAMWIGPGRSGAACLDWFLNGTIVFLYTVVR